MKTMRFILSLSIVVLASTSVYAQFLNNVGIKVGATVSNVRITDIKPIYIGGQYRYTDFIDGNVVNPTVSLFVNLIDSEHFILQSDFGYLRKGASKTYNVVVTTQDNPEGTGARMSFTSEYSLQYLEFAMIAQPNHSFGDLAIYAQAGPTFSHLLSTSNFFASISELRRFQVGYTLGLGANFGQTTNSNIFVEIRYNSDFHYFYNGPAAKFWNRWWVFSLGTTL